MFLILIFARKAWILERIIRVERGQIGIRLMIDRRDREGHRRTIGIRTVTRRQRDDTIGRHRARMSPRFLKKNRL